MSALPKAVQAQIAKANEIADQYYGRTPATDPAAPAAPVDPAAAPPAPAAAPPAPAAAAPAPAEPATPAAPVAATPAIDYEQRYKVLQGKYNAEVPRLNAQVRELTNAVGQLRDELTGARALLASLGQPAAPAGTASPASPAPTKLVKDEEVREFGADLIDVMRRVVREEIPTTVGSEVERRIAPVARQVREVATTASAAAKNTTEQRQQAMYAYLAEQVPNYAELDVNPAFIEWLDQIDPYASVPRQKLLDAAVQAHDGPRVVAFFKGFLKEHAVVNPANAPTPAAAPAPAGAPQQPLEALVAPGTSRPGTPVAREGSGKREWTRAEISQFYRDVQMGRYATRQDEMKRLEADIFAAQRENRVR